MDIVVLKNGLFIDLHKGMKVKWFSHFLQKRLLGDERILLRLDRIRCKAYVHSNSHRIANYILILDVIKIN